MKQFLYGFKHGALGTLSIYAGVFMILFGKFYIFQGMKKVN